MSRSSSREKGTWSIETGGVGAAVEGKGLESTDLSRKGRVDAGRGVGAPVLIGTVRSSLESGRRPGRERSCQVCLCPQKGKGKEITFRFQESRVGCDS